MKIQEKKIELQKKVHRRIWMTDITCVAARPPSYVFFVAFSSTFSLLSTSVLCRKKKLLLQKINEGWGGPPCLQYVQPWSY